MIGELFLPRAESIELKELGFDIPCFHSHSSVLYEHNPSEKNLIPAPLYQQAFKWFREKHKIEGYPVCIRFNRDYTNRQKGYQYAITYDNYLSYKQLGDYSSHEEAELACIQELIKMVKDANSNIR